MYSEPGEPISRRRLLLSLPVLMMAPRAFAQPDNPPIRVRGNESRDALGVGRSALGGFTTRDCSACR